MSITECVSHLLKSWLNIAFAESATTRRISAEFAFLPDAGKFLKGWIVCHDADLKHSLLGMPEEALKKYIPESEHLTGLITTRPQQLYPS